MLNCRDVDKTLLYYEENAQQFTAGTVDVSFMKVQDKFLALIPTGGKILDFGCGSGRDTKYFFEKGFNVDATDGSEELCKMASEHTGIFVKKMLFDELSGFDEYDGIWSCASILHLPKTELKDVLNKMVRATKDKGFIYTSFKYGDFEGYRDGRYYTDFTEDAFKEFIEDIPQISINEIWISNDVRPGRSDEKWLNIILQKLDTH